MSSLQEQLALAHKSHEDEREEAATALQVSQDSVDEALKARLDQSAPRVSVAVESSTVVVKSRGADGKVTSTRDFPDPDAYDGLANHWFEIVFQFTVKNWGDEPVGVTFPSPWENVSKA